MKRKPLFLFLFFFFIIIMSYMVYQRFFVMPQFRNHQGDGRLDDRSRRLGPFPVPGYSITMSKFDLDKPKDAEYQLAKLPNIHRQCHVYFAIRVEDDKWEESLKKDLHATLQLELRDSSGQTIVNLDGKLSDYIAYSSLNMNFIALYPRINTSAFFPDPYEKYTVHVVYTPDPKLKDCQGFVFIECGGHK